MKKFHFENTTEFEKVFRGTDIRVTDAIVAGIQEALSFHKKTASLFEVTFDHEEIAFEISLQSGQWEIALESCLNHYREIEEADKAIDTYLLQKEVRKWLS